jgi:bile acid transporter
MEIERQLLHGIDQLLLAIMIFIIMFGMGASLTPADFRTVLRRPRGVLIGFLSQFGVMPLAALGLALLLQLPPALAIALILIGCLPGGTTSNMFTYFARGSVALSISMTTASTLLALVMMPLLLDVYGAGFAREIDDTLRAEGAGGFVIPHLNIVVSLLLVLVPVTLGMILRWRSPGWAKAAEDTAGFMAIVVILYLIGSVTVRHSDLFLRTSWKLYLSSVCLGLLGFFFGFLLARLLGQAPRFQRAISLETGIQNGPIAFAIILLSFQEPLQSQMLWLAILYSTFIVMTSSGITLYFRRAGKFDWEVYRNTVVHNRLFGDDYVTHYPRGFLPPRIARDPSQEASPAQRRAETEPPREL